MCASYAQSSKCAPGFDLFLFSGQGQLERLKQEIQLLLKRLQWLAVI
jgi:hypothetical protein